MRGGREHVNYQGESEKRCLCQVASWRGSSHLHVEEMQDGDFRAGLGRRAGPRGPGPKKSLPHSPRPPGQPRLCPQPHQVQLLKLCVLSLGFMEPGHFMTYLEFIQPGVRNRDCSGSASSLKPHFHMCVCFVDTSKWRDHVKSQLLIFKAVCFNLQPKKGQNVLRTLRILQSEKLGCKPLQGGGGEWDGGGAREETPARMALAHGSSCFLLSS